MKANKIFHVIDILGIILTVEIFCYFSYFTAMNPTIYTNAVLVLQAGITLLALFILREFSKRRNEE